MANAVHPFTALLVASIFVTACSTTQKPAEQSLGKCILDYDMQVDGALQAQLEEIDARTRQKFGLSPQQTAVGVLDLQTGRVAMIHPDRVEYAASVPKIGILLAWFDLRRERPPDPQTRRELALMIKASSNEMAAKYSCELGLKQIQDVLNRHQFYDPRRGGGIWVGKHYGRSDERYGDPVGDHSHAATVRQLLRFYLLLEQGKLVSPAASHAMRQIFESPEIPHDEIKFVKGLAGRELHIIRKWGSWQNWLHDTAVIKGPGRHYILVALTQHPEGDAYLAELARAVDDYFKPRNAGFIQQQGSQIRPVLINPGAIIRTDVPARINSGFQSPPTPAVYESPKRESQLSR